MILIIDASFVAHRIFHAFGDTLTFNEEPTAVVYGFLQDVMRFKEEFSAETIVFAFDYGLGKRKAIMPGYKASREKAREEETDEQQQARKNFRTQLRRLRERYLAELGFRNILSQEGYEADDIIASIVRESLDGQEAVIISSDQDLWQLIGSNVSCWNPNKKQLMDRQRFLAQWGIEPAMWASVKAIAGCGTDDVPGLRGIGEKTAVKWFLGQLKPESVAYKKIDTEGIEIHNRNFPVVRLPFEGTQIFKLKPDEVTIEKWAAFADRLGMKSLRDTFPGMPKGIRKPGDAVRPRKQMGFGF